MLFLQGQVSITDTDQNYALASLTTPSQTDGAAADEVPGTVTFIDMLAVLFGDAQEIAIEIKIGGVILPSDEILGPWTVTRSRGTVIQSAQFSVLRGANFSPLGDHFAAIGPAPGKKDVDITGIVKDPSGAVARYPLITRGIVDNVSISIDQLGRAIETYNVLGPGARIQRQLVTYILTPNSGLSRAKVIAEIMEQAGESQVSVATTGTINKEIQLIDSEPLGFIEELLDPEARYASWSGEGGFQTPLLNPPGVSPDVNFTEDHIFDIAPIAMTPKADVITEVALTGNAMLPGSGDTSRVVESKIWEDYELIIATNLQSSIDCTVGAGTESSLIDNRLVEHTITTLSYVNGVLFKEYTEIFRWYNPEAARYTQQCETIDCRVVYLPGPVSPRDSVAAYAFNHPFWRLVESVETRNYYALPGMYPDSFVPVAVTTPNFFDANGYVISGRTGTELLDYDGTVAAAGCKLCQVTERRGYYNPRRAVVDDGDRPYYNVHLFGGGDGVAWTDEEFTAIEVTAETWFGAENGLLDQHIAYLYKWEPFALPQVPGGAPPVGSCTEAVPPSEPSALLAATKTMGVTSVGGGGGGANSGSYLMPRLKTGVPVQSRCPPEPVIDQCAPGSSPTENFVLSRIATTTYQMLDETSYLVNFRDGDRTEIGTVIGTAPTIECLDPNDPGGAFSEGREISALVTSEILEATHLKRRIVSSIPWAENADELLVAGIAIISESAVIPVTFTSPGNFLIREGRKYHVSYDGLGLDHDLLIESVTFSGDPSTDRPIMATATGLIYPNV